MIVTHVVVLTHPEDGCVPPPNATNIVITHVVVDDKPATRITYNIENDVPAGIWRGDGARLDRTTPVPRAQRLV